MAEERGGALERWGRAVDGGVDWEAGRAELPPLGRAPRVVFVRGPQGGAPGRVEAPQPPGSKYFTLRYGLNALLADGVSVVRFPALSDDTAALARAMRALGADVRWERVEAATDGVADGAAGEAGAGGWALRVRGVAGRPRRPAGGVIAVGNAGAVLRLLLGVCAATPEARFETDHPESLGRRPNAELLEALAGLGVRAVGVGPEGYLPITLAGGPPLGGATRISGARSSQYVSALLYLAPLLERGLEITVTDTLRSAPLARATLRALAEAGVMAEAADDLRFIRVGGMQRFRARVYETPGDGPTAAALVAVGLTLGRPLRLGRLPVVKDGGEDDVRALVGALEALGAPVMERPAEANGGALDVGALGAGGLHGAVIDGDACIDSVPALVAAACFAVGETRFEQVATLRLKESDRIGDLCAELRAAGCAVEPGESSIRVVGRPEGIEGGAVVASHDDHRLAQALAIVALRSVRGLTITGADAVAKSYPWFFEDLARMGGEVRVVEA